VNKDERLAYQWRWVRYKADNGYIGVPMYKKDGTPTQAFIVFRAIERMTR